MKRAAAGHPLNDLDQLGNRLISKLRFPGESKFAFIKRVFRRAHVMVTTIARVHVKMVSTAFAFDLY
jgi:IS5 family transposase